MRNEGHIPTWDQIVKLNNDVAALQAKCDRYEAALIEISGEQYFIGQEGCTWGDSKYDSISAAAGYNAAIDNVTKIANEALSAGEGEKEVELEPRNWNEYFENQKDDEE